MRYRHLLVVILLLGCLNNAVSQKQEFLSLKAAPGAIIPFGDSREYFSAGGGVSLSADYELPFLNLMFARGEIAYNLVPTLADTNMTILSLGAGAGIGYDPISKLNLKAALCGGYYYRFYNADIGGNAFLRPQVEINFVLSPSLSLGLNVGYEMYYADPILLQGLGVSVNAGWSFVGRSKSANIAFKDVIFDPIFPVFYKYYDENPLGTITIKNDENGTITNLKVSFYARRYMDNAKECIVVDKMQKGEEVVVPLYALFSDKILEVTEGTKVNAEIFVSYDYLGDELQGSISETVRVFDRNAMTWDDSRKAAAFVTAKDPTILRFSKKFAADIREGSNRAINSNFRMGMGLFEALAVAGVGYVVDPKTPYIEFSRNRLALDYLQFPSQTLYYKAGDCDDLSILYAAILESIGIETAFITVPGHIYTAFALDIPPEEAKKMFRIPSDLIYQNNNAWVPVEVTALKDDFLKAWQVGADLWRENTKENSASFIPLHQAWKLYEPVGIPSENTPIEIPDGAIVLQRYNLELDKFVDREIHDRVVQFRVQISKSNDSTKYINRLGVLYARFGLYSEAITEFRRITERSTYLPALVNLGNIYYIQGNMNEALSYYNRAAAQSPNNPQVLLGLSLTYFELERYSESKQTYGKLERQDSELASRYAYLAAQSETASRAGSPDTREILLWYEEE
jgi:tetratricopeptide (TPR) repeat protein